MFQCCKIGPTKELGIREGEGKEKECIQWHWKKGRDKFVFKVISSLDKWVNTTQKYTHIHMSTEEHKFVHTKIITCKKL